MNDAAPSNQVPGPDSRSLRARNGRNAVELYRRPEPGPRKWFVRGIIPLHAVTILYGHSGLGKSYIALAIAICVALGKRFLGVDTERGAILWVDREMDVDEMTRRAYAVARGMGMDKPPPGLFYYSPTYPIGHRTTEDEVQDLIRQHDIKLVIIDSLSVGSTGDMKEQQDTVKLLKSVEGWGTVVAIDHITKAGAAGNQSEATIFGSAMKRAIARSTVSLTAARGGGRTLRQDKSNFGATSDSIHFDLTFDVDAKGLQRVTLKAVGPTDPVMAGAPALSAEDQTRGALERLHAQHNRPITRDELAAERGLSVSTISNHITELKKAGHINAPGDGTYEPTSS